MAGRLMGVPVHGGTDHQGRAAGARERLRHLAKQCGIGTYSGADAARRKGLCEVDGFVPVIHWHRQEHRA
jgi:hypothetical protein